MKRLLFPTFLLVVSLACTIQSRPKLESTPKATLLVRVKSEKERVIRGLKIELIMKRASNSASVHTGENTIAKTATSNSAGDFEISGIPPGLYDLLFTPVNHENQMTITHSGVVLKPGKRKKLILHVVSLSYAIAIP